VPGGSFAASIRPSSARFSAICGSGLSDPPTPRRFGRPFSGGKQGLWRYRLSAYRLVCRIEEERLVVLVLAGGHRKEVYE